MAVSTNHELGGCVILLRLYWIDMVQKNYRGVSGYRPFQLYSSLSSGVKVPAFSLASYSSLDSLKWP